MDMYYKLNNQPLKLVLVEFRFPSIKKIADYINDIHDDLRRKYPEFESSDENVLHISGNKIQNNTIKRWSMKTNDKSKSIDVSENRLLFMTTKYDRYDQSTSSGYNLRNECLNALEILDKHLSLAYINRIGFRQSNFISINENKKIDDYIKSDFFSLPNFDNANLERKSVDYQIKRGNVHSLVRGLYGKLDHVLLPDLEGVSRQLNNLSSQASDLAFILDIDGSWRIDNSNPGNQVCVDEVGETLDELHEFTRDIFWQMTTKEAKEELWK